MPILDFEIIGPLDEKSNLSQILADAAADILKSKPGNTWVKLHFLSTDQYGENGGSEEGVFPIFISILLGQNPDEKVRSKIALELAEAASNVFNRPKENIHIIFLPDAIGRIAFGGHLKTV